MIHKHIQISNVEHQLSKLTCFHGGNKRDFKVLMTKLGLLAVLVGYPYTLLVISFVPNFYLTHNLPRTQTTLLPRFYHHHHVSACVEFILQSSNPKMWRFNQGSALTKTLQYIHPDRYMKFTKLGYMHLHILI